MSDFLSKFSKDNYLEEKKKLQEKKESTLTEEVETIEIEEDSPEVHQELEETVSVTAVEKDVDSAETFESEESNEEIEETEETVVVSEEKIITPNKTIEKKTLKEIKSVEKGDDSDHEVVVDNSYKDKKKKQKIYMIIGGVSVVILSILGYLWLGFVSLPEFTNKPMAEANIWAKDNGVTIKYEEEYSLDIDNGIILAQEPEAGTRVKKGNTITLKVSAGADPDQQVAIPELKDMDKASIQEWINSNKMNGVSIVEEYSTTVKVGSFIKLDIKNKDVTAETFKRKDKAIIYVSKGEETFEKDIEVPNFVNKTQAEVDTWITEKKFTNEFVFEEGYSDTVGVGQIISQSISPGTMISKTETITFVVSQGKAIYVADYSNTNLNTFETVGGNAQQLTWYSSWAPYGTFLEQSVAPGTNLSEEPETIVKVYYSAGRPYIDNIIGKSEGELQEYFFGFTSKGADISYSVSYEKSCEPKGTVIRSNKYSQYVSMEDHVNLVVSSGNGNGCAPSGE